MIALAAATRGLKLSANPQGVTVVAGSASTQQNGSQLDITVGRATILNWNSFNIQQGETTTFIQPSANSVVFNNIGGASPSQIWGNLTANGTVILANTHGFYFGPNSMIKIGGSFVATTAPLPPDLGAGSSWQFNGLPPLASIVNYGQIQTGRGHSLFLIAENIENHGKLNAPGGKVGLYAGKEVLVSERPDGRSLSATVTLPSGSVDNSGKIIADAGTIAMNAQVVNQNGIIQADSVRDQNGAIELVASDQLNLGANSQILARGDDSFRGSSGGTVTLKSENTFSDAAGSQVGTRGGARGGRGGNVEISAPNILSLNSGMDGGAQAGWSGGRLFIDPANIVLGTSGSDGPDGTGSVAYNSGSGTLNINVNTAFANKNFSAILLQAAANISLAQGTTWNLSQSTGVGTGQLRLQAGGDIVFGNNSQIVDANNWSVNLQAGVNFNNNSVQSGVGNIYLNGGVGKTFSGAISTAHGSIGLTAGQSIFVGTGFVKTTGGGSIDANALAGDINAGTANGGYQFSIFGYSVSPNLGGISTAAGGDVTLQAGNNIISTPIVPANQPPGASGAYGSQPGDVTLIAGNQITGNFTVANGTGTLLAGVQVQNGSVTQILNPNANVGSAQRPVNLSLIAGSWNVWAANNIYLNEVRNPNGTFNGNQLTVPSGVFPGNTDDSTVPTRSSFLFNYAADAAANLWAGDSITLVGANLPRVTGENTSMPPIYPPNLSLDAGAGGITILNSIILYPSSQGSLQIATRQGGNLVGAQQQTTLTGVVMSDSGLPDWGTFANGHATMPLHLNDPNPVKLDISGSIESFGLTVPTFARINVAGDTFNFGFLGRNLSPAETTSINVAGDITYRGDFTGVPSSEPLSSELLNPALSGDPEVAAKLSYDAATGTLSFIGQMTPAELSFLLNPSVVLLDQHGRPVLVNGQPELVPVTLDAAQLAAVQQLYAASQSATLGDNGLNLAGPGSFDINARNLDLGISAGINVLAPDAALAAISPRGANLNVNVSGNLDMTSTKISNESLFGGLQLTVGGALDVGGEFTTFGDRNAPKGIFTTSGGDVSVTAIGDVNVNGSRIAAYNGGDVTVESVNGDVKAGSGGSGFVSMNALELDPLTGELIGIPASIPGSGILATTLPGSHAKLGNILVETPRGDITTSVAGILQIPFNGGDASKATAEILAGYELRDGVGNPVAAGEIATGNPVLVSDSRSVDVGNSGILAQNLVIKATGHVTGLLVANKVTLDAKQPSPEPIIIFSPEPPTLSLPPGSGPPPVILSGGPPIVNGITIPSDSPATPVARNDAPVADNAAADTSKTDEADNGDDPEQKKKGKSIVLAQKTGRVTVIFPQKD